VADFPVCVKTPKGIEEVERRTHGLPFKARQVLIMVDGKRDQQALEGVFPPEMVRTTLDQLLRDGFIRALEPVLTPKPAAPSTAPSKQAPVVASDDERYELARNFMLNTTSAFVGVFGSSLSSRIELAPDLETLATFFGEWHDAIALSPDGKKRLAELDSKLLELLGDLPGAGSAPPPTPHSMAPTSVRGPATRAPAATSSPAASPGAAAPQVKRPDDDEERLTMARNFMINTTNTFIGIAGSTLIDKLERADSIGALRQLYYDWREALQLSKEAKARLPDLEKRLAALLS
jgi:hypothetical protein